MTSIGTPALPCFSIFNKDIDEIYMVSAVSTIGPSWGGPWFAPQAPPSPNPPKRNNRSIVILKYSVKMNVVDSKKNSEYGG